MPSQLNYTHEDNLNLFIIYGDCDTFATRFPETVTKYHHENHTIRTSKSAEKTRQLTFPEIQILTLSLAKHYNPWWVLVTLTIRLHRSWFMIYLHGLLSVVPPSKFRPAERSFCYWVSFSYYLYQSFVRCSLNMSGPSSYVALLT